MTKSSDTSERYYRCLNCGTEYQQFREACPNCRGTAFRTGYDAEQHSTESSRRERFDDVAAHMNPYIPR